MGTYIDFNYTESIKTNLITYLMSDWWPHYKYIFNFCYQGQFKKLSIDVINLTAVIWEER